MVANKQSRSGSGSGNNPKPSGSNNDAGQVYALVEWLSGAYTGTFTHNVKTTWITDFSQDQAQDFDESYVIEWRVPPQPKAGWPVYDGKIHHVSDDLQFLKHKREELEASRSTPKSVQNVNITSPDWKSLIDAAVQNAIAQGHGHGHVVPPPSPRTPARRNHSVTNRNEPEKVVVGKALVLTPVTFNLAKNAPSPGRMIGLLLRQSFSRRRLIKSSYAGQHRTTENGGRVQKPMLKKYQKMADIQGFVLERFPHMSQSTFGSTVNSFLGEKPNKKKEIEYVAESDSEASEAEGDES